MKDRRSGRIKVIIYIVVIVLVLAATGFLMWRMERSVSQSVYAERKELLGHLTESSADIVNERLSAERIVIDLFTDELYTYLPYYPTLEDYTARVLERPNYNGSVFFMVDTDGKYYCSDGVSGKLVDTSYYTASSEKRVSYISTLPHMDPEKSYIIYRNRLPEPMRTEAAGNEVELTYVGILFDIDKLNETITKKFTGAVNTFLYDTVSGVMLYKQFGIRLLIPGFNIYTKLSLIDTLYGASGEAAIPDCQAGKTVVLAFKLDGEEYYFCSADVVDAPWSVAFIVQSSYLDSMSGNSFADVLFYIALIACILGAAVVALFIIGYKSVLSARSYEQMKQLNEELAQATKAKSDFLSNMSHDIRTPINGIMGMTTIAKNVPGNPEKTKECLNKIDGASEHLLSLINDVLDMTRIERGKTEIAQKPLDIRALSDNCCSIIRGQMAGRKLELISVTECTHTRLLGDDLHLRQIFINILGNAVKFTPDGGSIRFGIKETGYDDNTATLRFTFTDTGIGMSPEFLPKVFDTFTQDEGGARSNYKGTGLGMPIAKQLTELMGGTIEVESELNKGTTFTVTIPFTIDTSTPEEEKERLPENADITGVKILIAEDNELNMDIALELLQDAGARLTPVTDGLQALEAFTNSAPGAFDVILMDVMMPVMNGLDTARAIRSLPRDDARTIPILAMTANAFESDIQATKEAGMDAHLTKPIDIAEVVQTIAYHIRKK